MANFDWGYMAGSGNWAGVTTVDPAWMTTIDQNQQKGINATDGSTHAPTNIITIGGAGLAVSNFSASNIFAAVINGTVSCFGSGGIAVHSSTGTGGGLTIENAGTAVVKDGGTLTIENGADVYFGSTTAPIFLGNTVHANYPLLTSRSVYKRGLRLISTTKTNGSADGSVTSPVDAAASAHSRLYAGIQYQTIVVHRMDTTQSRFWLEVPGLIEGATLAEVKIVTAGLGTTPDNAFPSYQVQRHTFAAAGAWPPATIEACSVPVLDAHQVAADWGNKVRTTTLACTTNNVIDSELYAYTIEGLAHDSTSSSTHMNVFDVIAKYTVTSLRP